MSGHLSNLAWTNKNSRLLKSIHSSLHQATSILMLFMLIGAIIAAFNLSGAIPTLIYYALSYISPQHFLPIGLILCGLMSLAIGTTWGTIGTIGVVFMGVGSFMHIPPPITAGMVVSGACFGDKFSVLSDTTLLSASTTSTELYRHIKGMSYSIIPAFIITILIFYAIGSFYIKPTAIPKTDINNIQNLLKAHFHISILTLLPMLLMLGLNLKKQPALISIAAALLASAMVAILIQHATLQQVIQAIHSGPSINMPESSLLTNTLSHGGIQQMYRPMMLSVLILCLGGLLESYGALSNLFKKLADKLKTPFSLVLGTMGTSVISNMLLGEAYLTIILLSSTFKRYFEALQLDSCVLSKSIEEGATFSTPLIPWTTAGIFIGTTLGISASQYALWSVFNWLAPLTFLLFAAINFANIQMYQAKV